MNLWNIPGWLEKEVRNRDKHCIYCGALFDEHNTSRKSMPTWEHIVNDASIVNIDNIALCCCSCNASKGAKSFTLWLHSDYCVRKNITIETVADVAKKALAH